MQSETQRGCCTLVAQRAEQTRHYNLKQEERKVVWASLARVCAMRAARGFGLGWFIRALVVALPQLFRLRFSKVMKALRSRENVMYGLAGSWLLLAHELVCGFIVIKEAKKEAMRTHRQTRTGLDQSVKVCVCV